jgi:hypothetical protein
MSWKVTDDPRREFPLAAEVAEWWAFYGRCVSQSYDLRGNVPITVDRAGFVTANLTTLIAPIRSTVD